VPSTLTSVLAQSVNAGGGAPRPAPFAGAGAGAGDPGPPARGAARAVSVYCPGLTPAREKWPSTTVGRIIIMVSSMKNGSPITIDESALETRLICALDGGWPF
jgi:hypothetical protein